MKEHNVIGLMSGTSLDGVDIAHCRFFENDDHWKFDILNAATIPYDDKWKKRLSDAMTSDALKLLVLHKELGRYLGNSTKDFIRKNKCSVDFIASHGHTVFHQPEKKLTLQIGDGSEIAAACGVPCVCDFRSGDVALGGQGAPLVPIGDRLLFPDFDYCLNLGGFANISFEKNNERIAYDICPANIILNRYAERLGHPFDRDGKIAASGHLHQELFDALNDLPFYSQKPPKSLGREWIEQIVIPAIEQFHIEIEDKLNTYCHHVAFQISVNLKSLVKAKILVTGGGAYNKYLMALLKKYSLNEIIIPDAKTVEFKEALIFAFLGVLRMENHVNCLSSVTGACRDHSSGAVYLP